jgi:hypothetical protein
MEINKMRYKDVYIARYNNGDYNFSHEETVFNEYEVAELMGDEFAAKVLKDIAKKANLVENENIDITRISLDEDDIENELKKLEIELYKFNESVSGDDSYYDYFPDIVYAFQQICEAFNKREVYERVIEYLNRFREDEKFE